MRAAWRQSPHDPGNGGAAKELEPEPELEPELEPERELELEPEREPELERELELEPEREPELELEPERELEQFMTVPLNTSTVIGGRIMRLSPTAIDQFDDSTTFGCPTAWYFNRVLKVKSIETPAMLWGTAMHSRIEHYLRTGEDVLAKEERHGKSYIDAAKPYIIAIESPVLININGVQVDGKRDALAKWPGDKYEVIDWKSTSNIDEYAKTEDDMRNDTQVAVYAMDASLAFELSEVGVANVFFQKGSRRGSDKRSAVLGLKDLSRNFERIAGLIEQMKSVAAEKDIKKVPANREACSRGTGCQHFAACPNRMRMQSETKQVATFLDAMKKKESKLIIKDVPADAPVGVPGLSGAALDAQMARETAAAKKAALMKQLAEMEAAELAPPKVEEKPFSILPPDAPKWAPPAESKAEEKFESVPSPKKAAPAVPAKVAVVEELAKQVKDLTVEYDEEEVKAAVEKVGRGGKRPGAGRKTKAEELLEVAGVTVGKTTIRANRIELTLGFNQAIRDASNRSTYSTGIASVTIGADFSGDAKEAHAMLLELAREAVTAQLSAILPEHQSPMEAVAAGK